jgi:hypothetical protein
MYISVYLMNIQKTNKYCNCCDDLAGADCEDLSLEDADQILNGDDETSQGDKPLDDNNMETGQSVSVTSHSSLHRLQHRLQYLA